MTKTTSAFLLLLWLASILDASPGDPVQKQVIVDKGEQRLDCYEGTDLVFTSRVSTGRAGHSTPSGEFRAGIKLRMHYSSRYHHAPMPYSVQVSGHYFIHGYKDVPPWPASHGCIRLPLDGQNPAAWFFEWVETGTPISIRGQWQGRKTRPQVGTFQPVAKAGRAARVEKPSICKRLFGNHRAKL